MRSFRLLPLILLAAAFGMAHAEPLHVERVALGDDVPGVQAYNLQEAGDWRVFARSAPGFRASRLFLQRRDGDRWLPPQPLPFTDERWRDSDPHLSADGRVLTFVSDRPGSGDAPRGQLDLFESHRDGADWSAPRRLPDALQSAAYELGPERYGQRLYFASGRRGGPGALSVYAAQLDGAAPQPQALPAPVNEGAHNSDFHLTPDGRYAIWWSSRGGAAGGDGDLYLAERIGGGFGPALRLPEPVNGPGFEFTPQVSADGRWLYFASTRDEPTGLSHVYRTAWPALLQALGPAAEAASQAALDAQVSALWRAMGHAPGAGSDTAQLTRLLHAQGRVHAQTLRDGQLGVRSFAADDFVRRVGEPSAEGLYECEVKREQRRYGAHAQVYSVVQSRRHPAQAMPDLTGVNSMQWQLGPEGWRLLSLHYALELPGAGLPGGDCLA